MSFANALSDAAGSVGDNIKGVVTGENPLFAPQVANVLGFNIPGKPLISARDYFLVQMESWFTSIPLTTQWVVLIHEFPKCINTSIIQSLERHDGSKKGFDVDRAQKILTSFPLQKVTGCLFAQGFDLPTDEYTVDYINVENNRGFLPGVIAKERQAPGLLSLDFLETNTSFTDFVLRPWVIAGSHFGYVTRDPLNSSEKLKNVKSTITLLQYTRSLQNVSMIPNKVWHFYNAAPVNIGNRSGTYDTEAFVAGRNFMQTKWIYSHYTVENSLFFPLPTIIDRISKGQIPKISPLQK
jgi:hypothetical protein